MQPGAIFFGFDRPEFLVLKANPNLADFGAAAVV